nr:PspC domain-containing protein [Bacillus solimangrovi]
MKNKLRRSSSDKALFGVCGGIAEYFNISSFFVRLIFIFLPANLLIYFIFNIAMQDDPSDLSNH